MIPEWLKDVHPFVTGMLFMSLYPEKPYLVKVITQYTVVQWLFVFMLIYQGGGSQNLKKTGAVTLILFIIYTILDLYRPKQQSNLDPDLILE